MYLLPLLIASSVTLGMITLEPTPVLGLATQSAQTQPGDPDEVVVPTPKKPKGNLKPPVIHLPAPGQDPAPVPHDQQLAILIPAGTGFPARLTELLTSKTALPGDRFQALLDQDLTADGRVVVPRGQPAGRSCGRRPQGGVGSRGGLL